MGNIKANTFDEIRLVSNSLPENSRDLNNQLIFSEGMTLVLLHMHKGTFSTMLHAACNMLFPLCGIHIPITLHASANCIITG